MKIPTYLPVFTGFYNTLFEYIIDNATDDAIEYEREQQEDDDIDFNDFDFDYKELTQSIAESCVDKIQEKLCEIGITCKVSMEELVSPREYNFYNDSINVSIEFEDFGQVIEILQQNYEQFQEYIYLRYKGYDGFIPHYSNYASDWMESLKEPENCSHEVGTVLEFILEILNDYTDMSLYEDITDENCFYINYTNTIKEKA